MAVNTDAAKGRCMNTPVPDVDVVPSVPISRLNSMALHVSEGRLAVDGHNNMVSFTMVAAVAEVAIAEEEEEEAVEELVVDFSGEKRHR